MRSDLTAAFPEHYKKLSYGGGVGSHAPPPRATQCLISVMFLPFSTTYCVSDELVTDELLDLSGSVTKSRHGGWLSFSKCPGNAPLIEHKLTYVPAFGVRPAPGRYQRILRPNGRTCLF